MTVRHETLRFYVLFTLAYFITGIVNHSLTPVHFIVWLVLTSVVMIVLYILRHKS